MISLSESSKDDLSLKIKKIISPHKRYGSSMSLTRKSRNKPTYLEEIKKVFPRVSLSTMSVERTDVSFQRRRDANGIEINKLNKKRIKVTFIDKLNSKIPFVTYVNVESYKIYNYDARNQPFKKASIDEDKNHVEDGWADFNIYLVCNWLDKDGILKPGLPELK